MRLPILSTLLLSSMFATGHTEVAPAAGMTTYKDLSFFNNLVHFVDTAPEVASQGILNKFRKEKSDETSQAAVQKGGQDEGVLKEEKEKPQKILVEKKGMKVEVGKQKKVSYDTEFTLSLKWRPFRTAKAIKKMLLFFPKKIERTAFEKWAHLREKAQQEAEEEVSEEETEQKKKKKDKQKTKKKEKEDTEEQCGNKSGKCPMDMDEDEPIEKDFDDWSESDFEYNDWDEEFLDLDKNLDFCDKNKAKFPKKKKNFKVSESGSTKNEGEYENEEQKESENDEHSEEDEDVSDGDYDDDGNLLLQHCIQRDSSLDYPFFVRLSSYDPEVSSDSDDETSSPASKTHRSRDHPGYVLVDSSILVNMVCPHMLDEFRSSPQQWGKKRSVYIRLFNASVPSPAQMKAAQPMYFPGDHVVSSGSLFTPNAFALALGLFSWNIIL